MKLVLLIGPPAVGKMTVGQELAALTGLKLFHNHMTIEMVQPFFSYGTPEGRKLVGKLRDAFFEAFSESDEAGFIFTYVWAFDDAADRSYVQGVAERFESRGAEVFWVELEASLEERLRRNRTGNRLRHKPSKRDLDWSEAHLRDLDAVHRFRSADGEIERAAHLRIDTTQLSPQETAGRIRNFMT